MMNPGQLVGSICFVLVIVGFFWLIGHRSRRVVQVSDEPGLRKAIELVRNGDEIALADGVYQIKNYLGLKHAKNIILRSTSRDPQKVILRGSGFFKDGQPQDSFILLIQGCTNVTVEGLTFEEARSFGIKIEAESRPKNINILNCRFFNIGIRHVKGTSSPKHEMAVGGCVRNCYFENTKVPLSNWIYEGNYISAIDMTCLEDWTFSDNKFVNIKGASGGGRAAIFIWVESRNIVVKRNVIIGCDRGIALGNPTNSSSYADIHVSEGLCCNNFVSDQADSAIELAWVQNIKVYNNTCWRPDDHGRGIRCIERVQNTRLANNLVRGKLELVEGCEGTHNCVHAAKEYFVQPEQGDLHLTSLAEGALGKGISLPEVKDDIDKFPRKQVPDIGAAEYYPVRN